MSESSSTNAGFSVSVLTTHTVDSHPSLLVTFDNQRYLFNTPEAFSRIALQNKVGLRKVGHVFLGDLEQSAGLPGFVLSSVEAGIDKIQIFGPEGAEQLLASCRFFTRREKLSLKITSLSPATDVAASGHAMLPPPVHADANVTVHAFSLLPNEDFPPPAAAPEDVSPPTNSPRSPSSSTLKRKRSATSPAPPLRPKSPPAEPSRPHLDPSAPSFNPSLLRGDAAAEWRRLVLHDMFRGEAFEPRPLNPPQSPSGRRIPTPAYLPQSLPPLPSSYAPAAASYLVIGPRKRGKFLPEKAKALGVRPGKAFSRLIAGGRVWVRAAKKEDGVKAPVQKESKRERVERLKREEAEEEQQEGLGEGRWVDSADCMGQGQDATAFLVLNIPSPDYLSSLASAIPASLLQPTSLPDQTVFRSVFLFVGPHVLSSPAFSDYLASLQTAFPSLTLHVSSADFVAQGKNEVVFGPSALLNLRLRQVDEAMFQLPRYSFLPTPTSLSLPTLPSALTPVDQNSHFSATLDLLPPDKSPFGSVLRYFNFTVPSPEAETEAARLKGAEKPQETLERAARAWQDYLEKAKEAKDAVALEAAVRAKQPVNAVTAAEGSLEVTPLGTGSAIPSKYRNVSSTLLHLPRAAATKPQEYILLDAGEGTWGQIARRFGDGDEARSDPSKEDVLRGIKLVFISHLHQDHHAGLTTILRERAKLDPAPQDPLTIACPPNARTYLLEQHQLFDLGLSWRAGDELGREVRFLDNTLLEPGKILTPGSRAATVLDDLTCLLELTEVTAVPVLHRCRAWGVVVTHASGWKVVFSGDTMPCEDLAVAGKGASLLVHEATIDDDKPELARAKGHSTFGEAIGIATRMEARHLLLTHFSARYPKLPPLSSFTPADTSAHRPVIATAFDLMTVRLSDFWKVERYREAMDTLLSWDEGDDAGASENGDELSGKVIDAGAAEGEPPADGKKASKRQEKKQKRAAEQQAKRVADAAE
ncbi:hypothetical protein JCM10207_004185 [Rhodosporidiobolus poonsookiae]